VHGIIPLSILKPYGMPLPKATAEEMAQTANHASA
jgi:hypothetical protein